MKLFTADAAMAKAAAIAGSEDFGPDDFKEGLSRTLAAFESLPLTEAALAFAKTKLVNDLAMRCRVEAWYKAHPQVEDEVVDGPVLVCGMPRTGTTATVGLLSQDPRFRFLRSWEAVAPVPPPIAGEEDRDARALAARERAKAYDKPNMHIHDPDGPEEDIALLSPLNMHGYHGPLPMPDDYLRWWIDSDFVGTYRYHLRIFKLLQSRRPPGLWLLKAPPHLFKLEAFVQVFPNTRFVMTHRDPRKVIPSVASLQYTMQAQRCQPGSLDKKLVGRRLLDFWEEGVKRGLEARARIGEARFIDVRNSEGIGDPLAAFERIYAHLDMPFDTALRERILAYNQRNAPGAGGEHRYTAEEYGSSDAEIAQRFAGYIERFQP